MRRGIRPLCLPQIVLIRWRLLERLENLVNQKTLTVLHAPAGFGKSTLLTNFIHHTSYPICWYSLSEKERDPLKFLELLALGLTERFVSLNKKHVSRFVSSGNTETGLEYLLEVLQGLPPHVLIFDDIFKVEGFSFGTVMSQLLNTRPPHTKIILSVRARVNLNLNTVFNYIEEGQIGGLGEDALALLPDECQAILLKRFGTQINLDEASEIVKLTKGNTAKILFWGYLGESRKPLRSFRYSALAQHVIEKLDPETWQFLLKSMALPYLTIDLCERLGIKEPLKYIKRLQNIDFLNQSDSRFVYSEFLVDAFKHLISNEVRMTTAKLLDEQGDYIEAGNLLIAIKAWGDLIDLLERRGHYLYENGHAQLLDTWLTRIPGELLGQFPELMLLNGRILVNDLGRPDLAVELFNEVIQQEDDFLAAEAKVWRSVALRNMGEVVDALDDAIDGVEQLKKLGARPNLIAWSSRILGLAYRAAGNLAQHIEHIRQALGIYEALDDNWYIALCHHDLGVGMAQSGHIEGARYHYNQAIRIWQKLEAHSDLARTFNSLGMNHYLRGEYKQAEMYLQDALSIATRVQATRHIAFIWSGLGDLAMAQGLFEAALENFKNSDRYADRASARALMVFNMVRRGECCLEMNEDNRASLMARQAAHIATEKRFTTELGLAYALHGRISLKQGQFRQAIDWFKQAASLLSQGDRFEEIRARLLLANAQFRALRRRAAELELGLALDMIRETPGLIGGLQKDFSHLTAMLNHFFQSPFTTENIKDGLILLDYRPDNPGVQFYGLGEPSLVIQDRVWRFSSRWRVIGKTPEMLSYLLLEGGPNGCRKEKIQAAIWPDIGDDSYDMFHQIIKRLRVTQFEQLPQGNIQIKSEYYSFTVDWSDILAFKALVQQIGQAPDADEALHLRLELIDLYRGEFLEGFDGEWTGNTREVFENSFQQHLTLTVQELLRRGDYEQILDLAARGLNINPYQDELQQIYITARQKLGLDANGYAEKVLSLFESELGYVPELQV